MDADSDAIGDAGGSTISIPGLHPGELKRKDFAPYEENTCFYNVFPYFITKHHAIYNLESDQLTRI